MSQAAVEEQPPALKAGMHDVRYFATLLRGVNFANRGTVTITHRGMTITVEEARTLLGTAFIFAEIFDEYAYHPENPRHRKIAPSQISQIDQDDIDNAAFEIPLNTLIECLNIFGTAGSQSLSGAGASGLAIKRWKRTGVGHSDDDLTHDEGRGLRGPLDNYFGGGSEKRTGMRMTYVGSGHPLTLIIAEDASGPTTTCQITTFDPEPQLELDFDNDQLVLRIILKSSWLRDALSELDPSCEKLTFIGNPPEEGAAQGRRPPHRDAKPILRIQADGTFGSTEMDYPNDREVLETFECKKPVSFSYRFAHISRVLRALQTSTKTSLRIDETGLLSLQFLMPSAKSRGTGGGGTVGSVESPAAFIEFRCLAVDDEC